MGEMPMPRKANPKQTQDKPARIRYSFALVKSNVHRTKVCFYVYGYTTVPLVFCVRVGFSRFYRVGWR